MDLEKTIGEWIAVSNSYNTEKYLSFFAESAVLDDPSVGRKFNGKKGIKEYFDSYFIGYKTQTKKVAFILISENEAHLEVEFTGDFPQGKIGGTFNFIFDEGLIMQMTADLI